MDELLEQAAQIVDLVRKQNWVASGVLVVSRPDAVAVAEQLVRTAYSKGAADAAAQARDHMLETFDRVSVS